MSTYTESIEKLIERLIKLPGIGRRSAERIIGYILNAPKDEIKALLSVGFEYMCQKDDTLFFRKRK